MKIHDKVKDTHQDITATNQLIKVIRGDSQTLYDPKGDNGDISIRGYTVQKRGRELKRWLFLILIICLSFFTFLSIQFFSWNINNLIKEKEELTLQGKGIKLAPEPPLSWEKKRELAAGLNSIFTVLIANRPYISSIIKEITYIIPKNCFLNRLYISIPSDNLEPNNSTIAIEATLAENPLILSDELSRIKQSLEASPIFNGINVAYQDKSIIFDTQAIDFQLNFSLE